MCVDYKRQKDQNNRKKIALLISLFASCALAPQMAFSDSGVDDGQPIRPPTNYNHCSIRTGYLDDNGKLQQWTGMIDAENGRVDPGKGKKKFFYWGDGETLRGTGASTCDGLPLDSLNALVDSGASTSDVNAAISKIESEQNAKNAKQDERLDANDQTNAKQNERLDGHDVDLTDIKNKNKEQDTRLDGHDVDLTDIKNKNKEQDTRLDGHDAAISGIKDVNNKQNERLDGHDKDIGDIKDGAVFYNRDKNNKKTGGVTLNDGISKEGVQLSNVAKAKDGRDAVNLDQLRDSLGGEARTDKNGNYVGPKYTVGGVDYGNVGDALTASNSLAVKYTPDENGKPTNNIVLSGDGTGAPVGITNVAAGVNSRDAINKGQLDGVLGALGGGARVEQNGSVTAPTYNIGGHKYNDVSSAFAATDGRINEMAASNAAQFNRLDGRITDVRNDARAGIAGASALAAMRYDDRPGKISVASGFGGFKDHQAMSVGVGYTTADSVFRMNAGASYDFQNDGTAWNIGLGWTLN